MRTTSVDVHHRVLWSLLGGLCLLAGTCAGADPVVMVRTVDGSEIGGQLIRLDAEGAEVRDDAGAFTSVSRADLLRVTLDSPLRQADAAQPWVLFANGDRAAATVEGITGDRLQCRWSLHPDQEPWSVPLEVLRGAILQPPALERERRDLVRELSTAAFDGDTLRLLDGGVLTGELDSSGEQGFVLATSVGPVTVGVQRVRSLALSSSLVNVPAPPTDHLLVTLTDGSWLTCSSLKREPEGMWSLRTTFGVDVPIDAGSIRQVDCFGERVRLLSESRPVRESVVSYIGPGPPMQVNRNVVGGYLQLGDREYPRGLGMLSGTSATWTLAAEDRQFQATIGIDDRAGGGGGGGGGSVEFVVELDGRTVYSSGLVRGGDAAVMVGPVDVTGGSELTLRVDFGEFGNSRDFANWCHPLLLR